jgi:capsular polysaccharide biosynthesis protein
VSGIGTASTAVLTDTAASATTVSSAATGRQANLAGVTQPAVVGSLSKGCAAEQAGSMLRTSEYPAAAVDAPPASRDWMIVTKVETAAPCAWTGDLMLGEGLRDGDKRLEFEARGMTGCAVSLRMRDVTLVPSKSLVFKDGKAIGETRFGLHPAEERAAVASLAGPHRRIAGRRVFLGLNRFCANYFHMLTQIVPAFAAYDTDPEFSDGILLLGAPGEVLYRALQLAAPSTISNVQALTVPPGVPLDVEDLTYSSFLSGCSDPSAFCRSLFSRMAARATVLESTPSPPAIYISRSDSVMRPMRNEHELITTLARFGVVPVVLSRLTLDEQIILFRNARVIIAPHGAGLANVVFAAPGTVLYELFPSSYVNPAMNRLAQMQGLHYWCDVYKGESRPGLSHHHASWLVDIVHIERRLRDLQAVYGALFT